MARILIVDDEPEILDLMELYLKKKGFQTLTAVNGEEALRVIDRAKSIDLIVLDHKMPVIDGAGVLDGMKDRKRVIPVVLLTGSLGKEAKELSVDSYLMKPVDLDELLAKVNELLGKQEGCHG